MNYVSTRGRAPELGFADVMLRGLASDGGLYMPKAWPSPPELPETYADAATAVMAPFVGADIDTEVFASMVADAYSVFAHPEVVPVVDLGGDGHLLELFHGPTLAFKDVALQLVGRLFDHELKRRGERATIVVATSGDTGSAAIEACRGRDAVDIVVLHPADRVSEVQRRQMTTVVEPNVHNIALEGTFDDCQDLVKAMFADEAFRSDVALSAMNSINWARVMPQIVYYFTAARSVAPGGGPVRFVVPSGNFGNVLAGYMAMQLGAPIQDLVVASNRNDVLTRFIESGELSMGEVHPTHSPSMDIQVSSNLERLLFDAHERNGPVVETVLTRFRSEGRSAVEDGPMGEIRRNFSAYRVSEEQTVDAIRSVHEELGMLIDPHTAVGVGAARQAPPTDVPTVVLATADPAKFPDVVEQATGVRPPLPERLSDLLDRPEAMTRLPNDLAKVQDFIRST